jgi:hypothetical protein
MSKVADKGSSHGQEAAEKSDRLFDEALADIKRTKQYRETSSRDGLTTVTFRWRKGLLTGVKHNEEMDRTLAD